MTASIDSDTYERNVKFWERAWSAVKTPYTQMPDLPYLESIPAALKKGKVQRVLDLGCGSGWLAVYLARQGFAVTGVDVAPPALELAGMWAMQEKLPIDFQVADIAHLSLPPGSFDAVVANSIFEHLTYDLARSALAQLKDILRPGGIFFGCFDKVGTGPGEYFQLEDGSHIYTDRAREGMLLRNFSDDELVELFAGWEIISLETIESGSRLVFARS